MKEALSLIIGIILIAVLGLFAICSCIVSSECSRYEDYHRKSDEDE